MDVSHLIKTSSYIDGKWVSGSETFPVLNPATGEVIANLASAGKAETEQAVAAAKRAQAEWKNVTANERSRILRKWFQLMMDNQEALGRIMTMEQGKPLAEAKGEIAYGAGFVEWYAEEAKRIYGDTIPAPTADRRIVILKQPIGVVAAITPWNFPNSMITRKAAPAIAAGCSFVLKPAKETPLSALALAQLAEEAGMPAGLFNVVVGKSSSAIGDVLTKSPDVMKFSFTGSTPIGKMLAEQCASTVKKVSLELGGNAPFIVFEDADLDAAVEGALISKYRNAGQTCVCTNRILVQNSVVDKFVAKLAARVEAFKIGNGLENGVQIGPMINQGAAADVAKMVANAIANGAKEMKWGSYDASTAFYPPTILTNVTNNMDIAQNEIFGPVAPIITFETEAEAIRMANDTEFGLAAYFYTKDMARIWRVGEALEYGMVGINEGIISNPAAPFGGIKQSGVGREGSKYGMDDYLEIKYLCMGGIGKA